jgi:CubicO group peptidase (beta-lactamase class C family)
MRSRFWVWALASLVALTAANGRTDEIDDYAQMAMAPLHGVPGMAIAVIKDGKLVLERYYGLANVETHTQVTKNSVFRFQSISKQFSVAATMRLVEQGRIGLEDNASKYLDELPLTWQKITVYHLLSNTSGIADYRNEVPVSEGLKTKTFSEVLQALRPKERKLFPTGECWHYSNTGFWILAAIVSKQTCKPYRDYLREEFLSPLGMTTTRKGEFPWVIVSDRVNGYVEGIAGDRRNVAVEDWRGDGDAELIGTLGDLVKWDMGVTSGKVVKPETLRLIQTEAKLNSGERIELPSSPILPKKTSYGLGCFIGEHRGHRVVWTPGAGFGFSTSLMRFPDDHVTVIVLCNLGITNLNLMLNLPVSDVASEVARGIGECVIPGLKAKKRAGSTAHSSTFTSSLGPLQRDFTLAQRLLDGDGFKDRCTGASVDLPGKAESDTRKQFLPLFPRPLLPPDHQHPDVQHLSPIGTEVVRDDDFDDEQLGVGGRCGTHATEDRTSVLVVPIVEDLHDQIRVAAGQSILEEVPCLKSNSIGGHIGRLNHVRQVEQDPPSAWYAGEDSLQQMATSATYVADQSESREVVGGDNTRDMPMGFGRHRLVEHLALFRVRR